MMSATGHHHASAVLVGEAGVLIRGASGAGKTQLALALIAEAERAGLFARLVGDDRIGLTAAGDRLVARPHPAIAGHVERRGLGLAPLAHEGAGMIRLVVDCLDREPARLPEPEDMVTQIEGVTLPRLGVMALDPQMTARLVMAALELLA
jgi:serine kinase of HPr protein (carbohydrate metabolism regulator)